jgi:hypothetical protein
VRPSRAQQATTEERRWKSLSATWLAYLAAPGTGALRPGLRDAHYDCLSFFVLVEMTGCFGWNAACPKACNSSDAMILCKCVRSGLALICLAAAMAATLLPLRASANVYATNIRINGATNNVDLWSGTNVSISYILNEPATLGVAIRIFSGTNSIQTLVLTNGGPGTLSGTNTVLWDGTSAGGTNSPPGDYSVSITAASSGYTNWTQTTCDTNIGNIVYEGRGIAVDKNAWSPYYGRIFVTVSDNSPNPGAPGDTVGVLKLNADGSLADEGATVTGGHRWNGLDYSPWKVEVSADDFVYISDLYTDVDQGGEVFRWDPLLSTNSLLPVLRQDNHLDTDGLSGPFITGTGTNTQIWMVDNTYFGTGLPSRGVLRYDVRADGSCVISNTGTVVVGLDTNNLNLCPVDVAVDRNGAIYVAQDSLLPGGDTNSVGPRVLRFPAPTNQSVPELTADWTFGGDTNSGVYGVAVDPTGIFVAVSFVGYHAAEDPATYVNGSTKILYATNGAVAAELDLNTTINGVSNHKDTDCAWDAVGNVYYIDTLANGNDLGGAWRAFSPPGTNQATTLALQKIHVPAPPVANPQSLTNLANTPLPITLTGSSADNVSLNFSILIQPTNGAVTGTGSNVVYQPNTNYFGPDQFAFRVDDGRGYFADALVTILNISAAKPVAISQFLVATQNVALPITLLGTDSNNVPLNFSIITQPTNGVLSGAGSNVVYHPYTNFFGTDQFTFRVDDGQGNFDVGQVELVVGKVTSLGSSRLAIAPQAGGQVRLTLQGDPYERYNILASQDLVHWTVITNLISTNGVLGFIDPDAWQFSKRFYRSALQLTWPNIAAPGLAPAKQFGFSYSADIGRNYQILGSTNLVNWDVLTTTTATNQTMLYRDADASHYPARFYRARLAP